MIGIAGFVSAKEYWNELRERGVGAAISRWSLPGGAMPGYFHVLKVNEFEIEIAGPRRRIPRKAFEKIAGQWEGYQRGRCDLNLGSYGIYIISILRWLDQTWPTASGDSNIEASAPMVGISGEEFVHYARDSWMGGMPGISVD